jgi:uncharacterized protein (DUF488 family)
VRIQTIGFAKKPARTFFGLLRECGARRLIDVRLSNASQLAGFTKRDDLEFFLAELCCGMDYSHELGLAPTKPMLNAYRRGDVTWEVYQRSFIDLMAERRVEQTVSRELLDNSVLLCSEATARHCHRRLVAEYLAEHWDDVAITHL